MDTKSNPTPTKHQFTVVQSVQRATRLGAVLITFPVYLQTTTSAQVSANRRRGGSSNTGHENYSFAGSMTGRCATCAYYRHT